MQITIPRGELKEAVAGLTKVVAPKSSLPVLGQVRFEATRGGIVAQATDLDQHLRYRFSRATSSGNGAFMIPLLNLKELGKGNEQELVELQSEDGTTITIVNHVGSHTVRHPVAGLDPSEWPAAPAAVATEPADRFVETYRRLLPFASDDATRYVLNGVFVEVAEEGEHPVTMVATDGRRLSSWNTMNLPVTQSFIVPLAKFLHWNGLPDDVGIGTRTEGKDKEARVTGFALSAGPWSYLCKTIEGTFPNWRQAVPGVMDDANRIVFTDEDVAALDKILPTFPGSGTHGTGIALRRGTDGKLALAGCSDNQAAESVLELSGGSRFEGSVTGVGVNAFFLLDALHAGFRVFTFTDPCSPLRSEDGRGGLHALMPLRLGDAPVQQEPPAVAAQPAEAVETTTTAPVAETVAVEPPEQTGGEQTERKGTRRMTKEADGNGTTGQGTALDKVLVAVETAKGKLREAVSALSEVADAVKTATKEGKVQAADLERARSTLQRLQAISL